MATPRATPLTPVIGAIVEGVQVAQPLNDEEVEAITNALVKYQVLFFRNQTITPQQQRDFAQRFGDLHIHPIYPNVPEAPQILILDADGEHPPNNEEWHTDVTFIETPPLGSVLSAKQLPPIGGDTMWASGTAAYEALSEPFKRLLQGLQAEHDFAKAFSQPRQWNNSQTREDATAQWEEAKKAHPPLLHPVVRTHPVSGKKAIFVNENFTTRIVGVQPRESEALLGFLYAHTTRPEFCVRWRWQEKDVAFWDNRVTQHSALADYLPHRRIMNRATILGDKPF